MINHTSITKYSFNTQNLGFEKISEDANAYNIDGMLYRETLIKEFV